MSSKYLSRVATLTSSRPSDGGRTAAEVAPASPLAEAGRNVPPLQWWRRLPADASTTAHLQTIRKATYGIGMIGVISATNDPGISFFDI